MWWRLKIGLKLVLSRIPIKNSFWRKIHIFKNGYMDNMESAKCTFEKYIKYSNFNNDKNFNICEVGVGDGLYTALFAKKMGICCSYLIDVYPYCDVKKRVKIGNGKYITWKELLKQTNSKYLTEGTNSYKHIADKSINYIYSNAVLEHVRKNEFDFMLKEHFRILKHNSYCMHGIDFSDHLGGKQNNLRISSKLWEKDWFANSGFYTNRISPSEIVERFVKAGFTLISIEKVSVFDEMVKREQLKKEFKQRSREDLSIAGAKFIFYKN